MLALQRPPTHPGEMRLEECLDPAGLTQVEAAWRMAMPVNRLNEVVRGKRGVTADPALRLARLLDTSAEMWLALGKPPPASVSPPEWPRRACRRHVTATCGIIPIPVLRQGSTHSPTHTMSRIFVPRAVWHSRPPRVVVAALLVGVLCATTVAAQEPQPSPGELGTLPVPGGRWALAELGVPPDLERASALRVVIQRQYDALPAVRTSELTLARVQAHLDLAVRVEHAARAAATGGALSLATIKTRQTRERVAAAVEAFGGKLRERRNQYTVTLETGRHERDVHASLKLMGLDVADVVVRLNKGDTVTIEVPADVLPLALSMATWSQVVFQRAIAPRALFAELLRDPNALLVWHGAMAMDAPTRRFFEAAPDLVQTIYREAAPLFSAYSAQVSVRDGRVQVEGGAHVPQLWEGLVDESLSAPARFVRRLFTRDDGRLAVFFDLMQHLPLAQSDFATGKWIARSEDRLDRFRALYGAVSNTDADWKPALAPLKRYPADPWLLLRGLSASAAPGGNGLAGPQQRRFWDRAFEGGLPDDPARALRDVDDEGPYDAAWLVERVCHQATEERTTRFRQVMVVPRAFPAPQVADLPGVLLAARGLVEFPALLLDLERTGLLSPSLAVRVVRQADLVQRVGDSNRRALALMSFQGAVSLLNRLVSTGALSSAAAAPLATALMAVPLRDESFGSGVAEWLVDRVVPVLRAGGDTPIDEALVHALAVGAGSRARLQWEGASYVVDWTGAERRRLTALRKSQGGASLAQVLGLVRLMRDIAAGPVTQERSREHARAVGAIEKALTALHPLAEITEPVEPSRLLPQVQRELERVRNARDDDRTKRAAERVGRVAEWVAAHLLLSLAYTPHLGDPAGAAARAGDLSVRHQFGVHEVTDNTRRSAPWQLPSEESAGGALRGALLGVDLALARLSLRRLSTAATPGPTLLTSANQHTLAVQVALTSPRETTGAELSGVVAALARGRERLQAALGDAVALDALAASGRLGGDRRSVLGWMLAHEPAKVPGMFSLGELVAIGQLTGGLPAAFGTPSMARDGRLRLSWPDAEPWEAYSGRPTLGLLAALVPDTALRIAEFTVEAKLPPELYAGVLAFAVQDLLDSAALLSSEDWLGLVRHARALTRERFEDYVSALVGIGVLTPAEGGREP